ncbi:cytochrome C biogenesis protein [Elysia marginata]|uniref:Cytochrome C biogenesis protein n=1 Tax=Elysia marginata TaxID=1093978 RepID=A0AAV4FSM3_9GAST|nr:cytochrome C biogenesis protein [Elysia marginata]
MVDGDVGGKPMRKTIQRDFLFSNYVDNYFLIEDNFKDTHFSLEYLDYLPYAKEGFIESEGGSTYLKLVESGGGERHDHYLKSGSQQVIHGWTYALNRPTQDAINIDTASKPYKITLPIDATFMTMATREKGQVKANETQELRLRTLYNMGSMQFVIPEHLIKGKKDIVATDKNDPESQEMLKVKLKVSDEPDEEISILGGKNRVNIPENVALGNLDFHILYGSLAHELPFSIKLNDFIAKKYPGTESSYSSFESKVSVQDDKPFDYRIYMNHILDHRGYRFFQSSFDPDELGTVLSVNHDRLGTWVTYIGYSFLYLGLLGIMFYGKTRFRKLSSRLKDISNKRIANLVVLFFLSFGAFAQQEDKHGPDQNNDEDFHKNMILAENTNIDSIIQARAIPKKQAELFGSLVIQDDGGRMKPLNTFTSELLRKISKSDTYAGLDSDQFFLSVLQNPVLWYYAKCIYLKRGNDSIRKLIGVPKNQKYARVIDFFDSQWDYKLSPYLTVAYKMANPSQFEKDLKNIDLRLGLFNRVINADILKVFPIPNDSQNRWLSPPQKEEIRVFITDSLYSNFIQKSIPFYLMSIEKAKQTGDYSGVENILRSIKENQRKHASDIVPSDKKVKAEILYNRYDVFKKLFSWYMYFGTLMLLLLIVEILKSTKIIRGIIKSLKFIIFGFFGLHTVGLLFRWYISGHAPWSDAYESMIYVAWATMGMGVLFSKRSNLTFAATAFITSMILMVAHWNWLDPAITNLQPVLNSYWLMIHVAIIVASYGPFTLGMIVGVTSLVLILLSTSSNRKKIKMAVEELSIVNELALTVGLVMLTIGNFLGAQWANESWGRYWGWDPKETWALISIMVYAFVLHMRLVPKLRGLFAYNIASVIAFGSIMMTYFGVNFYLSGLHSYASGEKVVTPSFVYYIITFIAVLGTTSYVKYRKYWN